MALSQDLINQFVKLTNKEEKPKEVTVNGTYKTINGEEYVQIDGSEIWTPVTSTVEAETGERVKVLIKNHTATVTGNISSPSARNKSVQDLKDEVDENGNSIRQMDNTIIQQGNSIIQMDNNIKQVENTINQHNNVINQHDNVINQIGNTINQQNNEISQINNKITQQDNNITQINNDINQQNNIITQHGNAINQQNNIINQQNNIINMHGNTMEVFDSNIQILNSAFKIEDGVLTGLDEIIVDELETNHLNAKYANIDFSNIQFAAVRKIFSDSGIIKDLVVQSGKITGELIGVTIKGDLIEGNTIKADKLVVKGEDGLYYKLNIDGLNEINTTQASKVTLTTSKPSDWDTNFKDYYVISNGKYVHVSGNSAPTWAANTYYKLSLDHESGLDGTVILAKSVTADKVQVSDLVAFDATIGGFHIGDHSLYSGVKNSINNTTRGIYMDDSGQVNIGDSNNFLKYFLDTSDNTYKLRISAGVITMGGISKTLEETINEIEESVDNIEIGGRNYLSGYVDKNGATSLTIRNFINQKYEVDTTTPSGYRISLELSSITENAFVYIGAIRDKIGILGIKDGDEITISYYAKTDSTTNTYGLGNTLECLTDKKVIENPVITTSWKRISYTGKYSTSTQYHALYLIASKKYDTMNVGEHIYISSIKIEKGNKPTDWTPATEDIYQAIDDIEIGGENILRGTNKQSALSDGSWSNSKWRSASAGKGIRSNIAISDPPNSNIKYGFKLDNSSVSSDAPDFDTDIAQDNVPVNNGVEYTLSCYARGNGTLNLQYGKSPYIKKLYDVTSEWKKYKTTFTIGAVSDGITNGLTNIYFGNRKKSSIIEICGLKLEVGNKATDWSASYNDIKAETDNDINNAVSNISIGGRNLLRGTDIQNIIEGNSSYWTKAEWCAPSMGDGSVSLINITDSPVLSLNKAWKISNNTTGNKDFAQQRMPKPNNTEFTFSVWCKGTGTLLFRKVNTGGVGVLSKAVSYTSWTKVFVTFEESNLTGFQFGVTGSCTEMLFIAPKLEAGNKPTDWSPAPEDVYQAIDDVQIGGTNLIEGTKNQDTSKGNFRNSVTETNEYYMGCRVFKSNGAWADIGTNLQRLINKRYYKIWRYFNIFYIC